MIRMMCAVGVVVKIEDMMIQSRLWWYGHVMRGDINSQIREVMEVEMLGKGSTKETVGRVHKERFLGQVDSTEFAKSAESAENYNYLSSSIKQPKNYLLTYSDTFSWILLIKNHPNFIFR